MVLGGMVNKKLVAAIEAAGMPALDSAVEMA